MAALAPYKSGVRTLNAAAPRAWTTIPTADILESWWENELDLSYYRLPGNELHGVFSVDRIKQELGFSADRTLQFLEKR